MEKKFLMVENWKQNIIHHIPNFKITFKFEKILSQSEEEPWFVNGLVPEPIKLNFNNTIIGLLESYIYCNTMDYNNS